MMVDLRDVFAIGIIVLVGFYGLAWTYACLIFTDTGEWFLNALIVLVRVVFPVVLFGWAVWWLI